MHSTFFQKKFLGMIYKHYAHEYWPLVSFKAMGVSLMNIAYPDECSVYYCASFSSSVDLTFRGQYPNGNNALFWNLTFYDDGGNIFSSVEEKNFPNFFYEFHVKNGALVLDDMEIQIPSKYYCIIQRIYTKRPDIIFPKYVPKITGDEKNMMKYISHSKRLKNSKKFEKMFQNFYRFFHGVQSNFPYSTEFMKPPLDKVSKAFPNPRAIYYIIKLSSTKNVLNLSGTRPLHMNRDKPIQYASIMISNYKTFGTDKSISLQDLPINYKIYIGPQKSMDLKQKENILEWDVQNKNPVIVIRFLISSFQWNELKFYENYVKTFLPKVHVMM